MTFNTLISASDSKFAVRAYANHLDTIKQTYQKVTALLSTAAATDPEDIGDTAPLEYFSAQIQEQGFNPEAHIMIGDQEFVLRQAMIDIYNGSESYAAGDGTATLEFTVSDAAGSNMGYRDFVDGLVSNLHAITAAWAASAAALEESVSGRISLFRDKMQTLFADAYDDISSSVEYWTSALSENYSPSQWIPTAMSIMQVQQAADQEVTVSETDLYQYTGASPLGPLAFTFAANAVAVAGYVALQAYVGVCKGIIALGQKIFNWGRQKLTEIVSDPDDLYVLDKDAPSPSVDSSYHIETDCQVDMNLVGKNWNLNTIFGSAENLNQYILNYFQPTYKNKWLHVKILCGELFIRIIGLWQYSDHLVFNFDYKWRPYVLDVTKMEKFAMASGAPGSTSTRFNLAAGDTWDAVSNSLLKVQTADIYADSNSSEIDKANGMIVACETMNNLAAMTLREACGMTVAYGWYTKPTEYTPLTAATNADFVRLAMGYKLTDGNWVYNPYISINNIAEYVMLFLIHSYDRYTNPLSYSFLPYTSDSEDFEPGQWGIKTDTQNYQAFNSFGTKAVLTIAVIVATIYIGLKIRKWKRKKYLEKASYIGRIDNKMWNGQPVTQAEWDKYIKYSRKLDVSTLLDGKTTRVKEAVDNLKERVTSSTSNSADAKLLCAEIRKLITG